MTYTKVFFLAILMMPFQVLLAINSPSNVSPSDGATDQAVSLTLDWSAVSGNSGYIYQIDTVSSFDSPALVEGDSPMNTSGTIVSDLRFGTTYHWRVRAYDDVDTSVWSVPTEFATTDQLTNVSPSDGATDQAVSMALDWSAIYGNSGYIFQIDTVSSFDSAELVEGDSPVNTSETTISDLRFGTVYYWRARVYNDVDTSAWSVPTEFTTTDQLTNVSPSDGAVNQDVGLDIDWSYISGLSGYLYELDTVPDFSSPVLFSGSAGSSPSEASVSDLYFGTTYYWRVRAYNGVDTSAWSVPTEFTTANQLTNVSPSDGAVNQDVGLDIDWSYISGLSGYLYELDTVPDFSSPVLFSGSAGSSPSEASVSDLYFGTTYYWRVRAYNGVDTSAWSVATEFTTSDQLTNLYPSDGAVNQDVGLDIDWSYISGLSGYLYELDTVPDFSSPVLMSGNSGSSSSEASVSDLYFGTTYYWRVRAYNDVDTSEWSDVTDFSTVSTLSNTSPADGSMNIAVNPTLDWSYISGLDGYICQVDTSEAFNSPLLQQLTSPSGSSQADVSGLLFGTTYHWRVAAYHTQDTSEWTDVWEFTTDYELTEAPVLVSPADQSTDISFESVAAEWSSVDGADSYQYQYSTDQAFETSVNSGMTSLFTSNFSDMLPQTAYYWRVRAANDNGYSPWSEVWMFTTESTPLEPPVLVSPENNATGVDPSEVDLVWQDVFGASEFDYQVSTDSSFESGVTSGTYNDTVFSVIGVSEETQYFWRVRSGDGTQQSDWSETWSFTTGLYIGMQFPNGDDFQIYPNPARDFVCFKNRPAIGSVVEILNDKGQLVMKHELRTNRLDVSALPAGVYVVRVFSEGKQSYGKLLIR